MGVMEQLTTVLGSTDYDAPRLYLLSYKVELTIDGLSTADEGFEDDFLVELLEIKVLDQAEATAGLVYTYFTFADDV